MTGFARNHFFLAPALIFALALTACGSVAPTVASPDQEARALTVYAAASLTDAFNEIGQTFEASHPGVTVLFNFGGSQNLRTQIEQGAPADVFASADDSQMGMLVADRKIREGAPQIFLANQLTVILPAGNPAGILSLQDLARPGLKLVLAAEDVPAGKYARQVLDNLGTIGGPNYKELVLANVVSNEDNVKQVVAKVQLGEADAGIVYVSDAVAAPELKRIDIPAEANVMAEYPIAALVDSPHSDIAGEFIAYVLSPGGQETLKKWGFTPVTP